MILSRDSNGAVLQTTRWAWLLATWLGCGYSKFAPGTAGALGAIAVALPLSLAGASPQQIAALSLVFLYPAIKASTIVARESNKKDPQLVVIDEVLGQWLTLAGASHLDATTFVTAFILFRLFDIWKPFPIRRLENLPGGMGIVLDDMMAGIYGALVLFIMGWFNH